MVSAGLKGGGSAATAAAASVAAPSARHQRQRRPRVPRASLAAAWRSMWVVARQRDPQLASRCATAAVPRMPPSAVPSKRARARMRRSAAGRARTHLVLVHHGDHDGELAGVVAEVDEHDTADLYEAGERLRARRGEGGRVRRGIGQPMCRRRATRGERAVKAGGSVAHHVDRVLLSIEQFQATALPYHLHFARRLALHL